MCTRPRPFQELPIASNPAGDLAARRFLSLFTRAPLDSAIVIDVGGGQDRLNQGTPIRQVRGATDIGWASFRTRILASLTD
jgi:hypothetical protein